MRITYDAGKRLKTLAGRQLDFEDAEKVLTGVTAEFEDRCRQYGEKRMICYGFLDGRMVVIVYTPRGDSRHIISMRKANEREKARFAPRLEN